MHQFWHPFRVRGVFVLVTQGSLSRFRGIGRPGLESRGPLGLCAGRRLRLCGRVGPVCRAEAEIVRPRWACVQGGG